MATMTQLKRSSPEAQGIPSSAIQAFVRAVERRSSTPSTA